MDAPADYLRGCRACLVFGVGLQNEVPDSLVGRGVGERTEKRERAPFAIDGVLSGGEGHVAGRNASALPDPESNELEALERSAGEMQFGVCESSNRLGSLARNRPQPLRSRPRTCSPTGCCRTTNRSLSHRTLRARRDSMPQIPSYLQLHLGVKGRDRVRSAFEQHATPFGFKPRPARG